jgi:imidazolonepropionase-like amidohydrolase
VAPLSFPGGQPSPGRLGAGPAEQVNVDVDVDVYNALNADTILTQNNTYGATWLRPTSITSLRFVKLSARFDCQVVRRFAMQPCHLAVAAAVVAAAAITTAAPLVRAQQAAAGTTAYVGARLIFGDERPPLENATVVVRGGRFVQIGPASQVQVPADAARVALNGKTVMPTLVDTHVHLNRVRSQLIQDLQANAYWGIGAVTSLGSDDIDLVLQVRGETHPHAAQLLTAGRGITMPEPDRPASKLLYQIRAAEEGRQAVRELAARRVDIVKIWVDDRNGTVRKMPAEVYRAIIDEAHHRGLKVVAHIVELADAKSLVRAGLDGFAHGVRDRDVDDEFVTLLKEHPHVIYVPNLPSRGAKLDTDWLRDHLPAKELAQLQSETPNRTEAQRRSFDIQARNLGRLAKEGVTIAVGIDFNVVYDMHVEMEDMAAAGMTPAQVLIAATRNGAQLLGLVRETGSVEVGKYADFVVLDANPLEAITNTRRISSVYRKGVAVDRAGLLAQWKNAGTLCGQCDRR